MKSLSQEQKQEVARILAVEYQRIEVWCTPTADALEAARTTVRCVAVSLGVYERLDTEIGKLEK